MTALVPHRPSAPRPSLIDLLQQRTVTLRPLSRPSPRLRAAMRDLTLAFDRAPSKRSYSIDGHLHVRDAPISKAEVSGYLGKELLPNLPPGGHADIDPLKEYGVLRPPEELKKAAPTFRQLPLLWTHKPLDSEHHPSDITCGATGTDVHFADPWLRGSLVVWVQSVIDAINDGINSLSCGYHFDAIPERGAFRGKPYQFRMANIVGNHVAVVDAPRVRGAQIADSPPLALHRWR